MITPEQIQQFRSQYGIASSNTPFPKKDSFLSKADEFLSERQRRGQEIIAQKAEKIGEIADVSLGANKIQTFAEGVVQTAGQAISGFWDIAFDIVGSSIKAITPDKAKKAISNQIKEDFEKWSQLPEGKFLIEGVKKGIEEIEKNPRLARNLEASAEIISFIPAKKGLEILKKGVFDVKSKILRSAKDIGSRLAIATTPMVESAALTGVKQGVSEFVGRAPRAVGKIREGIEERTARATRLKSATPEVKEAIISGLDDKIINTIQQADKPTMKVYKKIVDIAKDSQKTLGLKRRPEIVAGRIAEEQFSFIEKARKYAGKKIGSALEKLSTTKKVSIVKSRQSLNDILEAEGIEIYKGGKLNFSGSSFTPAERTKIQELYKLANEGGDILSPKKIYDKDRLFSKLQRETRMEGVGDIMIDTPDGVKSLFGVFRDVYSNLLDSVSPEDIRKINVEYRKYKILQDDIENSIVKSGNFETVKNTSGAEFAQTNLRRLLSDAQSATAYREIVAEMDKVARELGYRGANAEAAIAFATEMRNLYPEVIPAASFIGGIRTGMRLTVGDILGTISKVGRPDIKDRQKALEILLESLIE